MSSRDPLAVKVEALDSDVREIKESIRSLGNDMRQTFNALSTQFAERQRTPWGTLLSAAAVLLTFVCALSYNTFTPINDKLKYIQDSMLPRNEANLLYGTNDRRLTVLEKFAEHSEDRKYNEMIRALEDARAEARLMREKLQP